MNKTKWLLVGIATGAVIMICFAAQNPPEKQYWQDGLIKPDQKWIEQYGYSDDSVLAYNVRRIYAFAQQQQSQIKELQQWVISQPQWSFVDMNEPKFKLEKKGLKEPILSVGDWSDPNNK